MNWRIDGRLWLAAAALLGPTLVHALLAAWPGGSAAEFAARFSGGAALAQQKEGSGARKVRRDVSMNAKVHEKLAEAQALTENRQYGQAIEILNALRNGRRKLNGYELASIWNLYGFIHYSQENYAQAERAYQTAVQQSGLPVGLESSLRYTLAQLYALQEKYREAVGMLLAWFKITEQPGAEPYVFLAQSYYQLEQAGPALASLQKAFDIARRSSISPKEGWYQLLMALHYHNRDFRKIVPVLKQLIVTWPNARYWLQLSGIYGELEDEKTQLAVLETAYMQNMLSREHEIVNLASLLLNDDAPWQAAKALERGIEDGAVAATVKNLDLLSTALRSAQETKRAIAYLLRAAEKDRSDDGRLHAKLSTLYLDEGQYDQSIAAAREALKRKSVKKPEELWMTTGVSHFEMRRYEQARDAFHRMARSTDNRRQKRTANEWIKFIHVEEHEARELEKALAKH